MRGGLTVAAYALRESLRRRVLVVVLVLSAAFLGLYGWGVSAYFAEARFGVTAEEEFDVVAAATLLGLAMFATLFLGAVLAVFLTHGVVRGDADRGLLQPLVVRPLGRGTLILARLGAAAAVAGGYAIVVFLAAVLITGGFSGWWPDRVVLPALALGGAVAIVAALSLLGSIALSATANGIAVFMVFGAGLTAGLIGQIGEGLASQTLMRIGEVGSLALPFEALYQAALAQITADADGIAEVVVQLGPFGGAQSAGPGLALWAVAYLAGVTALAIYAFRRRDLS